MDEASSGRIYDPRFGRFLQADPFIQAATNTQSYNRYFYNYFRDYDPRLGRYIESDPIGLEAGVNTFGYVMGNPVGNIDPEGLDSLSLQTSIQIPSFLVNYINPSVPFNGLHSGFAIEYPGFNGGSWNFAGYFGPDFMTNIGMGKATLDLGYSVQGVGSLSDESLEVNALLGRLGAGLSFDPNTGGLEG